MAYQAIPPSNASPDWLPRIWNRVKSLNATLTREPVASNCTNIDSEMALGIASGTGAINVITTQFDGGGMEVTSGAGAGGLRTAALGVMAVSTTGMTFVTNSRTDVWAIYCKFKVVTAPASGAERLAICLLLDTTNDVGLGINASASTTNWALLSGPAGGTAVDTTVAFDTNWNEGLVYNDGTNLTLFVNWVQIHQVLSSSVLDTTGGVARTFAYNAAVAGTVNHYMNRWALFTTEP
jgi:hypothetical protein